MNDVLSAAQLAGPCPAWELASSVRWLPLRISEDRDLLDTFFMFRGRSKGEAQALEGNPERLKALN